MESNSNDSAQNGPGESQAVPTTGATVEEANKLEPNDELARVVEESKQKLYEEEQAPIKKRGRPRGSKSKPKEEQPASADTEAKAVVQSLLAPQYLSTGIQMIGKRAAINTGYLGWEFPKDEADSLATLADQCMARYFPNLSDTHALLAITVFSFGMAIGGRYLGYQDYLRDKGLHPDQAQNVEKKSKQNDTELTNYQDSAGISASSFFPQGQ